MAGPIPMSAADISSSDIEAVLEVLRAGQLALGTAAEVFESAVADLSETKHAVSMSSGTAALHAAVRALELRDGDQVLVPSFTFASSVNALLYERVSPVFVEVEPGTYNLDPTDVERKMTSATRGIMAVDVFGHP